MEELVSMVLFKMKMVASLQISSPMMVKVVCYFSFIIVLLEVIHIQKQCSDSEAEASEVVFPKVCVLAYRFLV